MNCTNRLAALGAAVPELLLPKKEIDLAKWAVIACDQHTQNRSYWEQARSIAGDSPSTLNLIYPEVYLEEPVCSADRTNVNDSSTPGREERIAAIHRTMKEYLNEDIFSPPQKSLVYVERDTPFHLSRRGLVIALDLEDYNWNAGSAPPLSLIRPTEGTVAERLPSRMEVRRSAPLETPHILVLIDDEENALLPALGERAKGRDSALYDTELMLDSGRVRGWKLDKEDDWNCLADGLKKLTGRSLHGTNPFLYAVGDGNHSLAAAKGVWEEYKAANQSEQNLMSHPARWALVELVNLYDPAMSFEPIHRLLFGTDAAAVQQRLLHLSGYRCRKLGSLPELTGLVQDGQCCLLRLGLISQRGCFLIEADPVPLAVDTLQPLLDSMIEEQKGIVSLDYIHGSEELFRLVVKPNPGEPANNAVGILLPPFRKQGLFETIAKRGPLPRKSFSMGESEEKRFYLECRRLFG
ncbi:MAG: DUF1015 family protein [Treponema sp.]|nr:DUF1015 family protein [Treponema sp.]